MPEESNKRATIVIDAPNRDLITVTVYDGSEIVALREISYDGPVDSRLLTTIDNMFKEHILDRFVFFDVSPGKGVDTASILYRIIATLSAALERTG